MPKKDIDSAETVQAIAAEARKAAQKRMESSSESKPETFDPVSESFVDMNLSLQEQKNSAEESIRKFNAEEEAKLKKERESFLKKYRIFVRCRQNIRHHGIYLFVDPAAKGYVDDDDWESNYHKRGEIYRAQPVYCQQCGHELVYDWVSQSKGHFTPRPREVFVLAIDEQQRDDDGGRMRLADLQHSAANLWRRDVEKRRESRAQARAAAAVAESMRLQNAVKQAELQKAGA